MTQRLLIVFLLAISITAPVECLAGGVLFVYSPTYRGRMFAVARPIVLESRSVITVSDSSIETLDDQTFHNDNALPVKGLYLIPVDPSVRSSDLEVRIDGAAVKPHELSSPEAFDKLKDLTRRTRDPSLLRLAGARMFMVEPITMSVNGKRTVTVRHKRKLDVNKGRLRLRVRMDGERWSPAPVEQMEVRIVFAASRPISALLSPSHHWETEKEAPSRVTLLLKKKRSKIRKDCLVEAFFSGDSLAAHVLTHKLAGRTGYFMAVLNQSAAQEKTTRRGKDVVLVLDSSGSMDRRSHKTAKEVIQACVRRLGPKDRFNVIVISTRTEQLAESLIPATNANMRRASRFVELQEPRGGTDLYNGLVKAALQFNRRKRPGFVVVAADGRATVGVTAPGRIVAGVESFNRYKARIFALIFGRKGVAPALAKLSEQTGGKLIVADKDTESLRDAFLGQLSYPQASKVSLAVKGVTHADVIPNPIPDLFPRETRVVLGRYSARKDTRGAVAIRARTGAAVRSVSLPVLFPRENKANPFIASIWAMRKLGALVEKKELHSGSQKLDAEIRSLIERFGFRYPFARTSRNGRRGAFEASSLPGGLSWLLKTSLVASDVTAPSYARVGAKLFRKKGSRWIDTETPASKETVEIPFLSDAYFQTIEENPEIGAYYALGPKVTVVYGGKVIVVR